MRIWTLLQAAGLLVVFFVYCGCASSPDSLPDEYTPSEISDQNSESIPAPLQEQDQQLKKQEAQVAYEEGELGSLPGGAGDSTSWSQEVSQSLASAARKADDDPLAAQQLMEKTLQAHPGCYQCAYNLGVLLERKGSWTQAVSAYQRALGIRPTHVQALVNLSNLHIRSGQVDLAKRIVETAVRKDPRNMDLRCQLITVLLASRVLPSAVEQAKGILLIDERNVRAMILLAESYYEMGKHELAERVLIKARDVDDKRSTIFQVLGFVYLKMDKLKAAIESFKKAVELDPNLAEARNNLGVLYQKAHDFEAATEQLRQAVAVAPGFFEAYLNLGNSLRGHRSYQEAEQAYKRALELRPDDHRALFNLGLMFLDDEVPGYKKTDRYKIAIRQLTEFRRKGGRHPKLDGYLKEAEKKYQQAMKAEARQLKKEGEKLRSRKLEGKNKQDPTSGEQDGL